MTRRKVQKIIYNILILGFLIGGFAYVCSRFIHFGNIEYTDNAQVRQHIVPINCRVQGFIKEIRFDEFQQVQKGDTLLIIEDTEYRLRVAQAEANLSNALSARGATNAGIATTENNIKVSDAGIEEVKVQKENAEREFKRYEKLYAEKAVTRQQFEQVKTTFEAIAARYEQVSRAKHSTSLTRNEQLQRLDQTDAAIKLAQAALELAQLNLSYTVILATCNGVTGKKEIHEGQLVNPGQTMLEVVDASELWVMANYRETQLPRIAIGAEVTFTADAVPGITYIGEVEAISDATGAAFSMIPHDNATGNFVKVEQRIPVRILIKEENSEHLKKLRAGLNVQCKVKY